MKYVVIICLLLFSFIAEAKETTYIEEVKGLGYVSGEGLACNAEKYPLYEQIARTYLISKAKSDEEQAEGMYEYNKAKAESFVIKKGDNFLGCSEINQRFNRQNILKTKVYKNGKLRMPDGKVIIPRQEYDARLVYNRKDNEREKLSNYYDKILERRKKQAMKEGIFQKIKREEQRKR